MDSDLAYPAKLCYTEFIMTEREKRLTGKSNQVSAQEQRLQLEKAVAQKLNLLADILAESEKELDIDPTNLASWVNFLRSQNFLERLNEVIDQSNALGISDLPYEQLPEFLIQALVYFAAAFESFIGDREKIIPVTLFSFIREHIVKYLEQNYKDLRGERYQTVLKSLSNLTSAVGTRYTGDVSTSDAIDYLAANLKVGIPLQTSQELLDQALSDSATIAEQARKQELHDFKLEELKTAHIEKIEMGKLFAELTTRKLSVSTFPQTVPDAMNNLAKLQQNYVRLKELEYRYGTTKPLEMDIAAVEHEYVSRCLEQVQKDLAHYVGVILNISTRSEGEALGARKNFLKSVLGFLEKSKELRPSHFDVLIDKMKLHISNGFTQIRSTTNPINHIRIQKSGPNNQFYTSFERLTEINLELLAKGF
jgi:hypothetical protein